MHAMQALYQLSYGPGRLFQLSRFLVRSVFTTAFAVFFYLKLALSVSPILLRDVVLGITHTTLESD
jgi:hypothetical protein